MEKGVGKKGQFYMVAAIIIATFVLGVATISNHIQRESSERIRDLEGEVKIESAYAADYSLNTGANFKGTMSDFTDNYIEEYKRNNDIYFLFGSDSEMNVRGYQNTDRVIILSDGNSNKTITSSEGSLSGNINPIGNEIILYLDELKYSFDIKSDRNFNFILSERTGGGQYIVSG